MVLAAPRGTKAHPRHRWHWVRDPGLSQPWDGAQGDCAAGKAPAASCSQQKRAWRGWEAATASCPSSQGCSCLTISLDLHLSPHPGAVSPCHTTGTFPCCPFQPRMASCVWPLAAGRNIWPDAAQKHRTASIKGDKGAIKDQTEPSPPQKPSWEHIQGTYSSHRGVNRLLANHAPKHGGSPKTPQGMETAPCHSGTVTVTGQDPAGILGARKANSCHS